VGSAMKLEGPGVARPHAAVALATLTLVGSAALGQTPEYQPQLGQAGKDVIWAPTAEPLVERMLTMAQVGPGDVVFDLGSGDGRTVIAAAKRGAEAVGVEYNPELVALSRQRAESEGLSGEQARFVQGDIFETDFSRATVVTLYLLSGINLRLRPTLLDMTPGTRVVSHMFRMGDWEPDETSYLGTRPLYLWIVPARIGGLWQLVMPGGRTLEMDVVQSFQKITGIVRLDPIQAGLREAWLRGEEIRFAFVDDEGVSNELTGTVSGDRMEGTFRAGARTGAWTATRR
jgi:SAM-dependent methyltransferase